MIWTEETLEERISRPGAADVEFAKQVDGDIAILGVGGKMGPTLAMLLRRSFTAAGKKNRIYGVARFSEPGLADHLREHGIEPVVADLLDSDAMAKLPEVPNVIYMAARKFGTTGSEHLTWAMNAQLPAKMAERNRDSRIVCFSSGNVYPLVPVVQGGASETAVPAPVGEYAQSVLGRERAMEYAAAKWGTKSCLLRLNYAIDLRYGVLLDIGKTVYERRAVDLRMPLVNVIWQGDANSVCFRALGHCEAPPFLLNLTGPETLSTRWIAQQFAHRFEFEASFIGEESSTALLNNAARCHRLFGYPSVTPDEMIDWTADWILQGGKMSNKPTHFQTRD